jgi:predicted Zn-dependent protease
MFYLGRTYIELGQTQKAIEILEPLIEKYPDFTDVHYFLGSTYGQQGDMVDAHYHLGMFYARRGKLKSAAYHLARALEITQDPKRREALEKEQEKVNQRIKKASQPPS